MEWIILKSAHFTNGNENNHCARAPKTGAIWMELEERPRTKCSANNWIAMLNWSILLSFFSNKKDIKSSHLETEFRGFQTFFHATDRNKLIPKKTSPFRMRFEWKFSLRSIFYRILSPLIHFTILSDRTLHSLPHSFRKLHSLPNNW